MPDVSALPPGGVLPEGVLPEGVLPEGIQDTSSRACRQPAGTAKLGALPHSVRPSAPAGSSAGAALTRRVRAGLPAGTVLALAYLTGSLPFSNLAAGRLRGVDLRSIGSGTVSGTGLYQVAGFRSLALVGCLDLAKGALGVALAGPSRPMLRAGAAAAALSGHNWSPFLRGAGGRGLAPALGATLVLAPEATAVLSVGLGGGRLVRHTAAGCFWAILSLLPVLSGTRGRPGLVTAGAMAVPLLGKRVLGNRRPARRDLATYLNRLVLDRDDRIVGRVPAAGPASPPGGPVLGRRRRH
ncbi:MAG: glycerol-3-phosphate acyltransferase [Acidimicrobiales bacterium]